MENTNQPQNENIFSNQKVHVAKCHCCVGTRYLLDRI